jgi:hypothetical protein
VPDGRRDEPERNECGERPELLGDDPAGRLEGGDRVARRPLNDPLNWVRGPLEEPTMVSGRPHEGAGIGPARIGSSRYRRAAAE